MEARMFGHDRTKKKAKAVVVALIALIASALIAVGFNAFAIDDTGAGGSSGGAAGGGGNLSTQNLAIYVEDNSSYVQGTGSASYEYFKSKILRQCQSKYPGITWGNGGMIHALDQSYNSAMARLHSGHKRVVGMAIAYVQVPNGNVVGRRYKWGNKLFDALRTTWNNGVPHFNNHEAWNSIASGNTSYKDLIIQQADAVCDNSTVAIVLVADDSFPPPSVPYTLSVTTKASAPANMTIDSADAVHDEISTKVDHPESVKGDVKVDVTLHYGGIGTRKEATVTKQATVRPGQNVNSPDFTPGDFKFKNWNGQQEAWKTWARGDYWFTIHVAKQDEMKADANMSQKEPAESFKVVSTLPNPQKKLYDETDKREVDESTEQLVYDMTYYAHIDALVDGTNDLWIRDIIDTTDVTVDNDKAYVTIQSTGEKIPADIETKQENGQTITVAHITNIVQPKGTYTLHVPQRPGARKETWIIKDTPGWSITGPDQFTDFEAHQLPVQPPTPDKVWVLHENGALTATDPKWTNEISDIENGHADTKTFLVGDTIGAVVNGKIRKNLVDPLKSYSITDDVSGSNKYIEWDIAKTKVFIDGKDYTAQFDVKWDGDDKIVATAKADLLKGQTGIVNDFGKTDHEVKLYIAGTVSAVGNQGETVKLVNDATENVNGQEAQTNEPAVYVWQPNPDKAWVKKSDTDGKLDTVIDPDKTNHATDKDGNVSGDDQTFLDGVELGSVVNGQVPANLAETPTKLVLYDDWTASDYIVDPQDISTVRVYAKDVDDTSKSTIQDIARTGEDVTRYFTITYDNTDLTKANKCTATAKTEYLATLLNLKKGKQITLVIPMTTNYAYGKGAEQVRKDYGANDGDEIVMTNAPDGKPFTNVAGETLGGSDVKTNVPWIHGYIPPVKKDVLAAKDEGGDQRSIDGGKAEPGDMLEYLLTTEPKFPASLSYKVEEIGIRDTYDELLTVDKRTLEVHDLQSGKVIPGSKYTLTWDDAEHQFSIKITDEQLLADWRASGTPRLQASFKARVASEDKIPDSRKGQDGYVTVNNQWFLRIGNGGEVGSNVVTTNLPPFTPVKGDHQSSDQGDPKIDIDGKTFLLNDTGEYHITLDASEYTTPSTTDKTTDAYNVYRLGIVDDYDDEYLAADAKDVTVIDEQGKDVTDKFNVQIKDGVLYVFAKLVDTVVPSTQETVKATQPDGLKAYADNDKHDPNSEPAIDQSLLGQKYTVIMPYRVAKVTDGYVVKNVATQLTDDRNKVTNEVSNPLKPLNPVKDVTITVGGDSVDGGEIVLNSFFNYRLESSVIPLNRAYQDVTKWGIVDKLDEKYDKFTGQWVVIARNDVYGTDGKVLFKAGDTIAESKAYHAAAAKSGAIASADDKATGDKASDDAKATDDANVDDKASTDDKASASDATDGQGADGDATPAKADADASDADAKDATDPDADKGKASEKDGDGTKSTADSKDGDVKEDTDGKSESEENARLLSDTATLDEKTEAYGDTPYFTATYKDGTYSVDATEAFRKLVSADTEHNYAWDAYIQCERTWVTDRHENVFTETFNRAVTDSNVVWTHTPEHPAITLEKYDTNSGLKAGDRDTADDALTVSGDTEIAFLITNTGDVPLVDVSLSDKTVDGTGTVEDIKFPDGWDKTLDPGESVTAIGMLRGVKPGTKHTDTGTVTGKSYYTGTELSASDDWNGKKDAIVQTGDGSGTVAGLTILSGFAALGMFMVRRRMRHAA